jgi:hypothetical protein
MSQYTKKDAAKDTESTVKQVSEAWHKAKDDAATEGGWGVPENRHEKGGKKTENTGNSGK